MNLDTLCLHADNNVKDEWGTLTQPICQSATFVHKSAYEDSKFSYSRVSNPTRSHVELVVNALENGYGCTAFSSGMAAITTTFMLFKPHDHIIVSDDLYGGALRLFRSYLEIHEIEFSYVDTSDINNIVKEIKSNTKAIYVETPTNPTMKVTDLFKVVEIAKKYNLLSIVDNTFLTPYFQRPLDIGCDIVIHSGTKYLGGHNDALAGFVVTNRKELDDIIKYHSKTIGANLSPFDAFLIERGIKTLAIRMDRINSNAIKIANYLKTLDKVKKVYYVGLKENPGYEINKKQSKGFGGMISIEVESHELAMKILSNVKIFQYAESLGGVDSLITYPVKQTHSDVPKEEREKRGINDRFLRISVGIENVDDLIYDLRQAIYE